MCTRQGAQPIQSFSPALPLDLEAPREMHTSIRAALMGLSSLDSDALRIQIKRDLRHPEASYMRSSCMAGGTRWKLWDIGIRVWYHYLENTLISHSSMTNGEEGYTPKGRDLNRFRIEGNAFSHLLAYGVCDNGYVPYYYGYIDRLDPAICCPPHLNHFANDKPTLRLSPWSSCPIQNH